jgi:hypothetical protein
VSASSYDPGALVAKLNEAAADGWDVVAIVPTGGDVSAFLRRSSGDHATDGEPTGEMERGAVVAEETAVEEPADAATEGWTGGEAAAADAALAGTAAEATDGVDSATGVIDVAEVTETSAAEVAETPPAVDEPAGWAVAPESAGEAAAAAAAAEEIPVVSTGPAAEAAAAEPAVAAAAEPSPAPAPEPAPAPAPEPAPVVTTPAGWYPDPSGRYELRYWDGTQWTEHVARQGQQFTDPPVR